jgi:hypothetical protein
MSGDFFHQPALADPGLAGHQEQAPAARAGNVQACDEFRQFTLTSDECAVA